MGQSYEIRRQLIEAYTIVGTEVYPKIIAELSMLLNKIYGPVAKASFLKFCTEKLKRGAYDIKALKKLKYIAYLGYTKMYLQKGLIPPYMKKRNELTSSRGRLPFL